MVAFNYPQPLLSGPPAGHHGDMTKYLISFPSEAMVLTDAEFFEAFNVGLVVGGSIVVPHLRRAVDTLDQINAGAGEDEAAAAEPTGGAQEVGA